MQVTRVLRTWSGQWRTCALMLVLLAACARPSDANARYDAWQAERPFVQTAWISKELSLSTKAELDYFMKSGLNTFWDGVRSGSSQWKHTDSQGLPTFLMSYGSTEPDLKGFIDDLNEAKKTHKNIIGIALGDEVKSTFGQGGLAHMRAVQKWIAGSRDPEISDLITFCSVPTAELHSDNQGIQNYWNDTFAQIRPDAWMAQIYPVGGGVLSPDYYGTLEWYFNWAKEKDVAMWCWLDTWSSSREGIPCESELRLQRFTSLAYGMRGFGDFLWHADGEQPSVKGAGYWDGTWKPTEIYKQLAVINREVANIAKSLIRLTPVRAYHMDSRDDGGKTHHWSDSDADLPAWMRRKWKLANVSGASNRNHLLVGFFRDAAGEEYFAVVNKDFGKDKRGSDLTTPVTLTFHPSVKGVQRLRRSDGKVESIPVKDNYIFSLPGGTGDLFKFDDGKPFAGVDELALPKLTRAEPVGGGTLCKTSNNSIVMSFDSNADSVVAEIHAVDPKGVVAGSDLAERFTRTLADNNRTVIYRENGRVLNNNASYRVSLHWADSKSLDLKTVRGDIDGDGRVSESDSVALTADMGKATSSSRADLDGNGHVDESDRKLLKQLSNHVRFRWSDSFEDYRNGPLAGNGPWIEVESLPSSVGLKTWVVRGLDTMDTAGPLDGIRKVGGSNSLEYYGNEARFHEEGGFGYSGGLRCGFVSRPGSSGFQSNIFWIWNSNDTAGTLGGIGVEHESGSVVIRGGRGVKLSGTQSTTVQGGSGKRMAIELAVDFDASKIIWKCHDIDNDKLHGPFELGYSGSLEGLDAVGLYVRGIGAQMDGISLQSL